MTLLCIHDTMYPRISKLSESLACSIVNYFLSDIFES